MHILKINIYTYTGNCYSNRCVITLEENLPILQRSWKDLLTLGSLVDNEMWVKHKESSLDKALEKSRCNPDPIL